MIEKSLAYIEILGGMIATLFGGWDTASVTWVTFAAIGYITGLIVAGVFRKSPKSTTGSLKSYAGWVGLCRKGVTALIILVACQLDLLMGSNFLRDATIIAFISNETISIIENAGLMGVPIPSIVRKAIDMLQGEREDSTDGN